MIEASLTEISKFLTEEVIDQAFKLKTNSMDSVKGIEVARAAPVGEGLLSAVFRIQVTGYQHTASFVVKGFINDPLLRKTIDCPKYFKREAEFFINVLPVLRELQIALGAKERIQNHIPICYSCHQDGLNDYILLEDLFETNCQSISDTPTEEQKRGVLKTLAHLHAVSMAFRIKKPEEFAKIASSLPEIYYSEGNRDWYAKYLTKAIEIDREVMAELEDSNSVYSIKFKEILNEDLYGQYISSVSSWGENPVFCHGDAWSPNFLFSPQRTVAIDFQIMRCASVATDLAYWNMLCCNHRTVKEDFLNAVGVYYSSLEYYLRDMGFDPSKVFSRETLDRELKLYGKYGFLGCLTSFPLLAADKCDLINCMEGKFPGAEKIPLEVLWQLNPLKNIEDKLRLLNAVRVAVDVGLI